LSFVKLFGQLLLRVTQGKVLLKVIAKIVKSIISTSTKNIHVSIIMLNF